MGNRADYNNDSLLYLIKDNLKKLVTIGLVTVVVTCLVSLLIEDKYESTVILYPTTFNSISKSVLSENNSNSEDILSFGEIEQSEQLIQILNSDEIRQRIVEKYNLLDHYDLAEESRYQQTKLNTQLDENISFSLTKYMAVEISVLDKDPKIASLIANDIAALLDSVKNRMRKEVASKALKIVEDQYHFQQDFIKQLEDSLVVLRQFGVLDYESQAERITEQLATAILQGKSAAADKLQNKLDILTKYGGAYISIRDQLEFEKKQLTLIKTKNQEAKVDAESDLTHKFVVNNAFPAEKPCYPIRWLIVIISTISVLILSVLILLTFSKR